MKSFIGIAALGALIFWMLVNTKVVEALQSGIIKLPWG